MEGHYLSLANGDRVVNVISDSANLTITLVLNLNSLLLGLLLGLIHGSLLGKQFTSILLVLFHRLGISMTIIKANGIEVKSYLLLHSNLLQKSVHLRSNLSDSIAHCTEISTNPKRPLLYTSNWSFPYLCVLLRKAQ